jgi:uncharacterized protein involved in exopolysaccharide biosynthesis
MLLRTLCCGAIKVKLWRPTHAKAWKNAKVERREIMWNGDRAMEASADRLRSFGAGLWRGRWPLMAWAALCIAVSMAYAVSVPSQFVARVDIVIAPQAIANDGPEDVRHFHQIDLDSEQAATELQVLNSERLLRPVFDSLALAELPELTRGRDGFWSMLGHDLHILSPVRTMYADRDKAYFDFVDRARCLRLGLSYVFEISYRSHDPKLAARVANALAAEYLADRIGRERLRQARIGGAYQAARTQALGEQWRASRAAAESGALPSSDLFAAGARVLGPATAPLNKSYPKLGPTLAMGAGIGLITGVLAILGLSGLAPNRRSRPEFGAIRAWAILRDEADNGSLSGERSTR